jgi:hypothetical protein
VTSSLTLKRQPGVGSSVIGALEDAWQEIRERHTEVPDAVIVTGTGATTGRGLRLGRFSPARWETARDAPARAEIFVGGEGLARGAEAVLATLLHEAAHAIAAQRHVKETSRQRRYHNRRFKQLAEQVGLAVEHHPSLGWSPTTLAPGTQQRYAETIARLQQELTAHRQREVTHERTAGARNLAVCACQCARRIRVARGVLAQGPIICSVCGTPFRVEPDG